MKFKSLFLFLCVLCTASGFAGTPDIILDNGDEPLTLKATDKLVYTFAGEATDNAEVQVASVANALQLIAAECTVSEEVEVSGICITITATAATCKEARAMIDAIL